MVRNAVDEDPHKSVRRISSETGISRSGVHRILRESLNVYPFKVQIKQRIRVNDRVARLDFANWMTDKLEGSPQLLSKIWFSDEAHFYLSGHVNNQNYRFWGCKNTHMIVEKPLHVVKCTVWCAVASSGIIGPYFFEENDEAVTVNGARYRKMLSRYFVPNLKRKFGNIRHQWFQQDGATAHTAKPTLNLIRSNFGQRIISLKTDHSWPPYSPDLNPLDYYLWGYLKDNVYFNSPSDIED